MRAPLVVALALLAGGACRGAAPPASAPGPQQADSLRMRHDPVASATRPRSRSDLLTGEEIRRAPPSDAYELVARLRPNWLRMRGTGEIDPDGSTSVQVWYNGIRIGPPEALRGYSSEQIISMRYVDPITARASYGGGHGRGVIAVTGR